MDFSGIKMGTANDNLIYSMARRVECTARYRLIDYLFHVYLCSFLVAFYHELSAFMSL
jgi:hypothetical protein